MKSARGLCLIGTLSPFLLGVHASETPRGDGLYAEFTTPRGMLTCELFFQKAPLTVANFVGLAEGTLGPAPRKPFFNGLTFHRVVPGFVVQGGDPLGTGEGGPGYSFPDEFVPGLRHDAAGILSMANSGPDTNGSQFFFTLAPVNRLNYLHSVFGRVVGGLEVLPQLKAGDTMSVKIVRQGTAAENFRVDEKKFAALAEAQPRATPPAFDDPSALLPTEPPRARTLNAKLENFRRATGVPLHVRLYEKFEPDFPGQTPAQFVAAMAKSLRLDRKAVLAVYFATEGQWQVFAVDRDLKLPVFPPSSASVEDKKRELLSNLNEVIDSLIVQLEPRRTTAGLGHGPPSSPRAGPGLAPAGQLQQIVKSFLIHPTRHIFARFSPQIPPSCASCESAKNQL
jgi:cyclophilin family peptidyl-prolyl cis-trans isomerase